MFIYVIKQLGQIFVLVNLGSNSISHKGHKI